MPVTIEMPDGKTAEVKNSNPDYGAVKFEPKPEQPSIKKPAPVIKPEPASKTTRTSRTTDKADKARTKPEPVKLDPKDYTEPLDGFVDQLWLLGSILPVTTPTAFVLNANKAQTIAVLNQAANSSPGMRKAVEKVTVEGKGMWMLGGAMLSFSMVQQTRAIMADPALRQQVIEKNAADMHKWLKDHGLNMDGEVQIGE